MEKLYTIRILTKTTIQVIINPVNNKSESGQWRGEINYTLNIKKLGNLLNSKISNLRIEKDTIDMYKNKLIRFIK